MGRHIHREGEWEREKEDTPRVWEREREMGKHKKGRSGKEKYGNIERGGEGKRNAET